MNPSIQHKFDFRFEKSSAEISAKAREKIGVLEKKVAERVGRVAKLRAEYGITDAVLVDLLTQARAAQKSGEARVSYSTTTAVPSGGLSTSDEVVIGAGVVNNLMTEADAADSERADIKRLKLIERNLVDLPDDNAPGLAPSGERYTRGHALDYDELEFLGF